MGNVIARRLHGAGGSVPFYALLTANTISGAGNILANLAIPWFVLQTTGSAGQTGITAAVGFLPVIVAGLFGGPLIDRFGYRRSSIIADLASGVPVAIIPLLYMADALSFGLLLALVFAGNLLDAPGVTARRSLVPEAASAGNIRLATANGRYGAGQRAAQLIGAPLAGVLIALIGASNVLWLNAASFAISAAIISNLIPSALDPEPDENDAANGQSYLANLRDGFRWIKQDRVIVALIISIALTNLMEAPLLIVMTVYASEVLESSVAFGIIFAGFGVGSTLGAFFSGWTESRIARRWVLPIGFSGLVAFYLTVFMNLPLAAVVGMATMTGLAAGPLNPLIDTIFQERVPPRMRGRVFGLRAAMMMSLFPLGVTIGGFIVEAFGYRTMLLIQTCAMSLAIAWMVLSPSFRRLGAPAPAVEGITR